MTVVLFASAPAAVARVAEWWERFERYRRASGRSIELLAAPTDGDWGPRPWSEALPDSGRAVVLWDACGRVPPKEVETLTIGFLPGEWRVGVERTEIVCKRGKSVRSRMLRRIVGWVRSRTGRISDPEPVCVLLTCAELRRLGSGLAHQPGGRWILNLVEAAQAEGRSVFEVPLMRIL